MEGECDVCDEFRVIQRCKSCDMQKCEEHFDSIDWGLEDDDNTHMWCGSCYEVYADQW